MSLAINKFIDRLKALESRGQREMVISLVDAKDLHCDITKLLLTIQELREERPEKTSGPDMEIDGGSF